MARHGLPETRGPAQFRLNGNAEELLQCLLAELQPLRYLQILIQPLQPRRKRAPLTFTSRRQLLSPGSPEQALNPGISRHEFNSHGIGQGLRVTGIVTILLFSYDGHISYVLRGGLVAPSAQASRLSDRSLDRRQEDRRVLGASSIPHPESLPSGKILMGIGRNLILDLQICRAGTSS